MSGVNTTVVWNVVNGKPLPTYLFNRWPTGAAKMQALAVFRHVHDPLRRLVSGDADADAAAGKQEAKHGLLAAEGVVVFR